MWYTEKGYAKRVVIEGELKIVGWPRHIPFRNLSRIGGGIASLRELHRLWKLTGPENEGERLRFVPSTAEDRANAALDPMSVHPNPSLHEEEQADESAEAASDAVESLVFHPVDLGFLGTHAESGGKRASEEGETRQRQQRSDIKRRRRRATDGKKHLKRLPKRGVTSKRCVIPGDGRAGRSEDGQRASKRARMDFAVDDRLEEIRWAS